MKFLQIVISLIISLLLLTTAKVSKAQDPVLPPANLGLSNLMDGIAGPPGVVYVNYTQVYHTNHIRDQYGHIANSNLKIDPFLSMHQFIWLTPVKLLGGNLGFTVLIPIVKISATEKAAANSTMPLAAPPANPNVLGDIVQGTAIQWSGKKLWGKPLSHRVEADISFPTGAYSSAYAINPSAHLYTFSVYHTFTWSLTPKFAISSRNQINYNTKILGIPARPGMFYNGNYSLEYSLRKNLWIEAAAYYLRQLRQDTYNGSSHYYSDQFGITDTREETFGVGGGIVYIAPQGTLIEAKMFDETGGRNRTQGIRPTLRIALPLTK